MWCSTWVVCQHYCTLTTSYPHLNWFMSQNDSSWSTLLYQRHAQIAYFNDVSLRVFRSFSYFFHCFFILLSKHFCFLCDPLSCLAALSTTPNFISTLPPIWRYFPDIHIHLCMPIYAPVFFIKSFCTFLEKVRAAQVRNGCNWSLWLINPCSLVTRSPSASITTQMGSKILLGFFYSSSLVY